LGLVGDGTKRGLGRRGRGRHGPAILGQNAGQDAIADRSLIGPPLGSAPGHEGAQPGQGLRLGGIAPQLLQLLGEMAMGDPDRLGREGENLLRQHQPPLAGRGGIRQQGRGRRRAVDEGQHLLLAQRHPLGEAVEEGRQDGDLAGSALTRHADLGQRPRPEHAGYRRRDLGRDRRMALDIIGEPGEDDAARDPLGQRWAEGDEGAVRSMLGMLFALLGRQPLAGELTIAAGHAIDGDLRIAVEEIEKLLPGLAHARQRCRGEIRGIAAPGDALEILEGEVGT